MGKVVKTTKILSALYARFLRDKLRIINAQLAGPGKDVANVFDSRYDGAYTHISGTKLSHNYRLVLGGKMVERVAELPETFSDKEAFKPHFNAVLIGFYALDLHEMGHIMFTDMKDTTISEYPVEKYRNFLHSLFNTIEDPIIELSVGRYYDTRFPSKENPRKYFDYMKERIFAPQCKTYVDSKNVGSFMQYLLLLLRCGKKSLKNTNEVFDKYSSSLLPMIKDILYEPNGTERVHKTVILGEWIIENIKEFDWSTVSCPKYERKSGSDKTPGAGGSPMDAEGGKEAGAGLPPSGGSTESETHDKVGSEPPKSGGGSVHDAKEDADTGKKPEPEKESGYERVDEELDDVFIDRFRDGSDHEWIIAKDYYEVSDPELIDKINGEIERYQDAINNVSKFLTLFHGRIRPRRTDGFTRGKLNVFRAMQDDVKQGCDTKLFTQEIKRGKDADLCVSLMCDNSGSMSGDRSIIASQAALVLAQACDWANIPFECNCFTKTSDCSSGTSITIVEKSFEDSFEKAKPFFGINSSELIDGLKETVCSIPTFSGNSEEINLYYLWKKFREVDHKTKLLFVMCDGCTTGSPAELKKLIKDMMDDGIVVVGIGIECKEVAKAYPMHKIFNSTEELENGLADYLIDTLDAYAR